MPSRVLVHLPPPDPPQLAERPPRRPARGEEYPRGWTVADYHLEIGEWEGEEYQYEVWVVPLLDEPRSHDVATVEQAAVRSEIFQSMFSVCNCHLGADDVGLLIGRLENDHTVASDEASAAIRFAVATGTAADALDRDLRDAIKQVLVHEPLPHALRGLRDALDAGCC